MAADPAALGAVADRLLAAKYPVLMAEYVACGAAGFDHLVALAKAVGAAVFDVHGRLNFPNRQARRRSSIRWCARAKAK